MKLLRPLVMIGFVAATLADTSAVQSPSSGTASWPPGLQQVSDESPARSPEAEMKTFFLPPGYRVELVASEPMVEEPILINGKEGTTGLMPPLGQTFTDEQIASVLTYVRRQWGYTGAPVDPQVVKDTPAAVAGRTRPWTRTELTALAGPGRQ